MGKTPDSRTWSAAVRNIVFTERRRRGVSVDAPGWWDTQSSQHIGPLTPLYHQLHLWPKVQQSDINTWSSNCLSSTQMMAQPGGSQLMTQPGGSQLMPQPGGSQLMTQPGGSQLMTQSGGSQLMTQSGGSQLMTQSGGSQLMTQSGGSQLMTQSGGSQLMTQSGGSQLMTQSGGSQLMPQPGGSQLMTQSGGSQLMTQSGGSQLMTQSGGSQLMTQPGGSQLMPQPGGSQLMTQPGGPQLMTQPGGSQLMTQPGGSQLMTKTGQHPFTFSSSKSQFVPDFQLDTNQGSTISSSDSSCLTTMSDIGTQPGFSSLSGLLVTPHSWMSAQDAAESNMMSCNGSDYNTTPAASLPTRVEPDCKTSVSGDKGLQEHNLPIINSAPFTTCQNMVSRLNNNQRVVYTQAKEDTTTVTSIGRSTTLSSSNNHPMPQQSVSSSPVPSNLQDSYASHPMSSIAMSLQEPPLLYSHTNPQSFLLEKVVLRSQFKES
ncbi:uncharacterized protein LOC124291253 [Haliotis rubra]|uniref:uncharacterized protein LOC124291253 n=1 Tax=Haliotis rubra TaxID=36100 RepID=UPI001EE5B883|nr:uncharacterized protein LOC124291253 [Haliotis rubra]